MIVESAPLACAGWSEWPTRILALLGLGLPSILSLIRVRDRPSIQYKSGGVGGFIQALSVGLHLAVPEVTGNLTAGHCLPQALADS